MAVQSRGGERQRFPVGFGRQGITCAGTSFEEGYTPLGRFRVNGILSEDTFVMMPALIEKSGRSEADRKRSLFRPMNAIDFNGDGTTGEYGSNNDARIGQRVIGARGPCAP